jgi:hypothetical protein
MYCVVMVVVEVRACRRLWVIWVFFEVDEGSRRAIAGCKVRLG